PLVQQVRDRRTGFYGEDIDERITVIAAEIEPEAVGQRAQKLAPRQLQERVDDAVGVGGAAAQPGIVAAMRLHARWPLPPMSEAPLDECVECFTAGFGPHAIRPWIYNLQVYS